MADNIKNEKENNINKAIEDKNEEKTENNNEVTEDNNNETNQDNNDEVKDDNNEKCESKEENTYCKEIDALKNELIKKTEESQKYLDMARRIQAEFDNYRKRTQKEKEELIKSGNEDIILEMIPVLDNLERAMQATNVNTEENTDAKNSTKAIIDGIDMVINQFKQVFSKFGVKEIEALGKEFDPFYHHAVMQEEKEGEKANTIIEVYQKGYLLNDKVIRPSMVKVAK